MADNPTQLYAEHPSDIDVLASWYKTWVAAGSPAWGGGGGSAGSPIVRKFPFAFDTPGILTGAALYTPTPGDILLDAWIEIDTPWDGTTPSGDIGTFSGQSYGLYAHALAPIDMRITDDEGGGVGLQTGTVPNLAATDAISVAEIGLSVSGANLAFRPLSVLTGARSRGIFTATNSIKVVVSQDGTNTGADPGSTGGAAVLYLVTATPA